VHFLELSTSSLFAFNVTLVVTWLALSVMVVRAYGQMNSPDSATPAATAAATA
jgi:hypothetical protein